MLVSASLTTAVAPNRRVATVSSDKPDIWIWGPYTQTSDKRGYVNLWGDSV